VKVVKNPTFFWLFLYTNYIYFSDRVDLDYKSRAGLLIYLFLSLLSLGNRCWKKGAGGMQADATTHSFSIIKSEAKWRFFCAQNKQANAAQHTHARNAG
jgi:hypothetical protein